MAEKGKLKIQCFSGDNYIPVQGCKVTVTSNYGESIEVELTTDSSGLTDIIELDAPAFENSIRFLNTSTVGFVPLCCRS